MKLVTFICTGNTCRSPMAECYFKSIVPAGDISVRSAGLAAVDGWPAAEESKQVMSELGLDLSGHQSSSLTKELVLESEMLLVMTEMHKEILTERWPEAKDKVYLLMEFDKDSSLNNNVFDPVGLSINEYRICFNMMKNSLDRLGEILCRKKS